MSSTVIESTSISQRSSITSVNEINSETEKIPKEQINRNKSLTFDNEESKILSREMIRAFQPLRILMQILFRFPLVHKLNPEDNSFQFKFAPKSYQNYGFLITCFILVTLMLLTLLNLIGTLLNYPSQMNMDKSKFGVKSKQQFRQLELYIFRRNIGPVIMITTSLAHATLGSIIFFMRRHFAASCLTFWTQAPGLLKINLAEGVRRYFIILMTSYGGIILLIIILNLTQFIPVATGTPGILAVLLGRVFAPYIFALENFYLFRTLCSVIFFYILICSKVYILLFLFQCKLLKNAFAVWNDRLERALFRGDEETAEAKDTMRIGFMHLFKDHICLLDMMDGADRFFASIIETYFGTQFVSICFEIYYFYRSQGAKGEFVGARKLDGFYILAYLAQTILILFVVSKSAADVGSTAMDGLEIIRRKGMIGKKSIEKIYFMLSMYISYNGHFDTALVGGKYFVLDNSFLVGITATIFSYFIILIQFTPKLSYLPVIGTDRIFLNQTVNVILENFEGTRELIPGFNVKQFV